MRRWQSSTSSLSLISSSATLHSVICGSMRTAWAEEEEEEDGTEMGTGCEQERPLSMKRSSVIVCNLALTDREMGVLSPNNYFCARVVGKFNSAVSSEQQIG